MKKMRLFQGLLGLLLIACLVLPASLAYAETPVSITTVAVSAASNGIGYEFQHHSFTDSGVTWVFYLDNINNKVVGSWSADGKIWVALPSIHDCYGGISCSGTQFDTWYDWNTNYVHFVVINTSVNNSPIFYARFVPDAIAHTLTLSGSWETVVAGVANVSYRTPTICVNNDHKPFITYGYNLNGSSDVYLTATNNSSSWVVPLGLPLHNMSANASLKTKYGSVIPYAVSTYNVSFQYSCNNSSVYKIQQNSVEWNGTAWNANTSDAIDTSGWYQPAGYEDSYNAVSIPTAVNVNDVAIQCLQTNGSYFRVFFNRKGAAGATEWNSTWARNFGAGSTAVYQSIGAMGIRDSNYKLDYSAWTMGDNWIYGNDYNVSTGNWSGLVKTYNESALVPLYSTMSTYKYDVISTKATMGFLYGTAPLGDSLRYGMYGPASATPSTVSTSVGLMAWIVILVFGALVCLILLAYGASESIKGGSKEFVKIGIVGLLTIIIAAIIVAATL